MIIEVVAIALSSIKNCTDDILNTYSNPSFEVLYCLFKGDFYSYFESQVMLFVEGLEIIIV